MPVSDVDRAKAFYTETVGLHADHDQQVNENLRFVQLTPPGSACSICIGVGLTQMKPGSLEGLQMVVPDIEQAHQQLKEELGLDHFEGRSWSGLHHHALLTMMAFAFLQTLRCEEKKRPRLAAIPSADPQHDHRRDDARCTLSEMHLARATAGA